MAVTSEGTIYIPMADFWEFVAKYYSENKMAEITYGVPRFDTEHNDMEIDFAASTEGHPSDWAKKPKAIQQWEDLEAAIKDKKFEKDSL